ncbi:MAG TPA: response regulator [Bacteroidota bacterium]
MSMFDLTSGNGFGLNRINPGERALTRLSAMARTSEVTTATTDHTRSERTAQPMPTSPDDGRKSVSDVLKRVDVLIRKGDLDQAERCVVQAREIDPKNIYAFAFEERIQFLKEQAQKNAFAVPVSELPHEQNTHKSDLSRVAPASFQDILVGSQSGPPAAAQKAQKAGEPEDGTLPEVQLVMNQFRNDPKTTETQSTTEKNFTQRGGETHVSTEDPSAEDRNLKIQRIIKIAVDAARKEVEQRQLEIKAREKVEAADASRRAEEVPPSEVRRKVEDMLLRKFQEQQELNRTGRVKEPSVNVPESAEQAPAPAHGQPSTNPDRRETLSRYKLVLLSAWADGAVTEEESATLHELRRSLSISHEEHDRIEQEVKREAYIEAFKRAWNSGTISPENASVLTQLRERFNIDKDEHLKIESALLWEIQPVKKRPTLLIVDDDERLLSVVSETLNHAGFITKSLTTSDEAYAYLRESSPDLILCDVNLETSSMGGFAFYEKVRELEQLRETPFIFLSGLTDEALVRAGKEIGVDDYLTKPVSEETLVASVKGKLRRYHDLKKRSN